MHKRPDPKHNPRMKIVFLMVVAAFLAEVIGFRFY
jgi:hypothetical protein